MKSNQILVILHSLDTAVDALGKSNAVSRFLKAHERKCAKRQGTSKGRITFRLMELSHPSPGPSPITMTLEARSKSGELPAGHARAVYEDIKTTLNDIAQGNLKELSKDILAAAKEFTAHGSGKITRAEFEIGPGKTGRTDRIDLGPTSIENLENFKHQLKPRRPGILAGKIKISPDFDKPVRPDEIFGGPGQDRD